MTILLLNFSGSIVLLAVPQPGALTHRLAALRTWCSAQNQPVAQ